LDFTTTDIATAITILHISITTALFFLSIAEILKDKHIIICAFVSIPLVARFIQEKVHGI